MAVWRQKAIAAFPELRRDFNPHRGWEGSYRDYHNFLWTLHWSFREAFDAGDEEKLARIFAFAEWCFSQGRRAKDLHSTICQDFYRSVFDVKRRDWPEVTSWLSPQVVATCRPVWERGMSEVDRAKLAKILDDQS